MTIDQLETRLRKNPRSPLFARLAEEYLTIGRVEDALRLCQEGLSHYPDYATAHLIRAKCAMRQAEYEVALRYLHNALSILPANPRLIELYRECSDHLKDDPSESLSSADVPFVSVTLAEIYAAQGANQVAIDIYRKLKEQRPAQAEIFEEKIRELKKRM